MIKERIKFLEDCEVEAQGVIRCSFVAGKEYDLDAPSARRWVKRNLAVPVVRVAKRPAVKVKAKKRAAKHTPMTEYKLPGEVDRAKVDPLDPLDE